MARPNCIANCFCHNHDFWYPLCESLSISYLTIAQVATPRSCLNLLDGEGSHSLFSCIYNNSNTCHFTGLPKKEETSRPLLLYVHWKTRPMMILPYSKRILASAKLLLWNLSPTLDDHLCGRSSRAVVRRISDERS